ncbi:hypothetical protein JXB28_01155 [Candidatus Woesearchaeota archaeon]|nr:hypothetical protein [Candidatus Woesearchaeota archaeon]
MKHNHRNNDKQKKALEDYLKKEAGASVRLDYVTIIDGIVLSQGSTEKKARERALSIGIPVLIAHYKYGISLVMKEEVNKLSIGYDLKAKKVLDHDEIYQRLSENYLS